MRGFLSITSMQETVCTLFWTLVELGWKISSGLSYAFFGTRGYRTELIHVKADSYTLPPDTELNSHDLQYRTA